MSEEKVVKLTRLGQRKKSKDDKPNYFVGDNSEKTFCNFCGRSENEVLNMVKGPGVNICSECTMIAVQYLIMKDRLISTDAQKILDAFWGRSKV